MFDFDSILNFFYIVAFLAAMVLPAFQKQRREEARKRAEESRRAEDVPRIEERDPSDVPEPVVRREPARAPAAASVESPEANPHQADSSLPAPSAAGSAIGPVLNADRPRTKDAAIGKELDHLENALPIGSIIEEIAATSIGAFESMVDIDGAPVRQGTEIGSAPRPGMSAAALGAKDLHALRQAIVWREVLDKPIALRRQRDPFSA